MNRSKRLVAPREGNVLWTAGMVGCTFCSDALSKTFESVLIVGLFLLFVFQHVVGRGDFFELLRWCFGIAI